MLLPPSWQKPQPETILSPGILHKLGLHACSGLLHDVMLPLPTHQSGMCTAGPLQRDYCPCLH